MTKILATASVLALMAAAPAWAANPASAPNGSVPYQPTHQAANANGNQAATSKANTDEQAANTNGAATTNKADQMAATPAPNTNGEQAATTKGAPAANNANEAAATAPNNASEQDANNAKATNQSVSKMDRKFVNEAVSASMAEIAEGKLAMQRASDLAVRQFGRWMVTDHTQMVTMLAGPAKTAGIEVSSKLLPQDQKKFDQLQSQNGVEFEKQYVSGQVTAHQKALQLFQQEAQSGQDAGLRAIAQLGEPMLKEHLAAAQELQSAMPEIVAATQNATKK